MAISAGITPADSVVVVAVELESVELEDEEQALSTPVRAIAQAKERVDLINDFFIGTT